MSVQTEIDRISTAVQNAHLKVIEKGGTSAAPYLVANLADAIETIPEATEPTLQSKSVTPTESAQTVTPDSGYDGLSSVAVGAISKTYVGSSVPKQAAQTITPGTADKTIASGRYLTGTQTIKGDPNLTAENIKEGVSIFGIVGNLAVGGLPSGVSKLATGTITPTEDAQSLSVTHNLGVAPNFLVWVMEEDTSSSVLTSTATMGATIIKRCKYNSTSSISYNVHNLIEGYAASSSTGGTATRVSNDTYLTTTTARMTGSSTYMIKAGKTYRWACGVLDGIA